MDTVNQEAIGTALRDLQRALRFASPDDRAVVLALLKTLIRRYDLAPTTGEHAL